MDDEKLQQANKLKQRINEFKEALNCFEWTHPEDVSLKYSTDPRLIIEFNGGDGREQIPLPLILSNEFILFMKQEIGNGLQAAEKEFEDL